MNLRLGRKIRALRKERNISQERLAQVLGVTFQAVSKWETEAALPDVTLIPAIASFFGVSTDELFDFNRMEVEQKVEEICTEAYHWRNLDPAKAERLLRNGLKNYPGNDVLLNNLLYTMRTPERSAEVIELCKALIESTKEDDVKYDALRILAETYGTEGEYALMKEAVEQIPELYFTKLELAAQLYNEKERYEPAVRQKSVALGQLMDMLLILADCYRNRGEEEKAQVQVEIAEKVAEAFRADFDTPYSKAPYEWLVEQVKNSTRDG